MKTFIKNIKLIGIIFCFLFAIKSSAVGQNLDSTFSIIKSKLSLNDPSKPDLYFHTDRDIYKTGEEVWFSAHLLGSNENLDSFHTLYVLLINEIEQKVVKIEKYALDSGFAAGKLIIPDSLFTASYGLVCYTNRFLEVPGEKYHRQPIDIIGRKVPFTFSFLKQFSKDSLKYVVKVNNDNNFAPDISLNLKLYSDGVKLIDQKQKTDKYGNFALSIPSKNELQQFEILASVNYKNEHIPLRVQVPIMNDEWSVIFLNKDTLIDKQLNQLHIQVIDSAGKPVSGKCQLLENDSSILSFKTDLQGYASFEFTPNVKNRYQIVYANRIYPLKQHFPTIIRKELSFEFNERVFENNFIAYLKSTSGITDCLVSVSNQKDFIAGYKLHLNGDKSTFKVDCSNWPRGLVKVSVYDMSGNIMDNQSIFLAYNKNKPIEAYVNSAVYSNRSKVVLKVKLDSTLMDLSNSLLNIRVAHAGTIRPEAVNMTKLSHLTYFKDENFEIGNGLKMSIDNNIKGILQTINGTNESQSFVNNPDLIEKNYDGHVLKGGKPLKSPINIYMGGTHSGIVATDSIGRFTLPYLSTRTSFQEKILLTVNFKSTANDFEKMYGLYLDTVGLKMVNWLSDKYYIQKIKGSFLSELPDEYKIQDRREVELDAVIVVAPKKTDYNEYFSEMGPDGICDDYVCYNHRLNCPFHTTGRRPYDGEIFKAGTVFAKPFKKGIKLAVNSNGDFIYRCIYKNMPKTMRFIYGTWLNEKTYVGNNIEAIEGAPIKKPLLYWNSNNVNLKNGEGLISFFTNDMKGDYVCDIQCISGTNIYTSTVHFVVKQENK